MSRSAELAYENAKKTQFNFRNDHTLEVIDASIIWRNFAGVSSETAKYKHKPGERRNVNLVLNDEIYVVLKEMEEQKGMENYYNIHDYKLYTDDYCKKNGIENIIMHYINVKVNMDVAYPPLVKLFTIYKGERSAQTLSRDNIAILDRADLSDISMELNCYVNEDTPDRCSMYLRSFYAIQTPRVAFNGKYDEFERPNFGEVINPQEPVESSKEVNPATGE